MNCLFYSFGCAIPQADTVIITGGYNRNTWNTVSVYTVEGWQEDLPPLNTNRSAHACSIYWSVDRRVRKYEGVVIIYTKHIKLFRSSL